MPPSEMNGLVSHLKGLLDRIDSLPWECQRGGGENNAPMRIASAPDGNGHRHTILKLPKTGRRIHADLAVKAVNALPKLIAALEAAERVRTNKIAADPS